MIRLALLAALLLFLAPPPSSAEDWELSPNFALRLGGLKDLSGKLKGYAQEEAEAIALIDPGFPREKEVHNNPVGIAPSLEISRKENSRLRFGLRMGSWHFMPSVAQSNGNLYPGAAVDCTRHEWEIYAVYWSALVGGSYTAAELGDFDLRITLFAGPIIGRTSISRSLSLFQSGSCLGRWENTVRMWGFGTSALSGLEAGWNVSSKFSLFLELAYQYAVVGKMKLRNDSWFDLNSDGVVEKRGDVFRGTDGKPYRFDYSGARIAIGTRTRF